MEKQAYQIRIFGLIQGVGARPLAYKIAQRFSLKGYVSNEMGTLLLYLQCSKKKAQDFLNEFQAKLPQIAHITHIEITKTTFLDYQTFSIIDSKISLNASQIPQIPLDLNICQSCLKDIALSKRFKDYPFTTCTACGARYSIVNALPYDRIRTSMKNLPMCKECHKDYENPHNRRFHAQPISCNHCAITMRLYENGRKILQSDEKNPNNEAIFQCIAKAIKKGQIIALKGVGGFNLIANANDENAIKALRKRKNRPHKPFAIMFQSLAQVASVAQISRLESRALTAKEAPIVLLMRHDKARKNSKDSKDSQKPAISPKCLDLLAPNVASIGAILPYNALMHLLFKYISTPLIFTSANISGEPLIADFENLDSLKNIYDIALDYTREIINPIDDSIVRLLGGEMRPLRLARGFAPLVLNVSVPQDSRVICGVSAHQKANLCFLSQNKTPQALITPYLGDLESIEAKARYERHFHFFSTLLPTKPEIFAHDLHPQYHSTAFAKNAFLQKQLRPISHHKAHFYAILGEYGGLAQNALGIIWDGTGIGENAHIWGGECFYYNAKPLDSKHKNLDSKSLNAPNSAKSHLIKTQSDEALQPHALDSKPHATIDSTQTHTLDSIESHTLDSAESHFAKTRSTHRAFNSTQTHAPDSPQMRRVAHFAEFLLIGNDVLNIDKIALSLLWHCGIKKSDLKTQNLALLELAFKRKIGTPTSSVGRLIDGVAYIIGALDSQTYEGQSGAVLENLAYLCKNRPKPYPFSIQNGTISIAGIIQGIVEDSKTKGASFSAYRFLLTLAHIALNLAQKYAKNNEIIYFSGGVFQNKFLCDKIHKLFLKHQIAHKFHRQIPCNDSCISFGQAVYGALS